MRKVAILLLALFAFTGVSSARSHRKPHKVTRPRGTPKAKRYRTPKQKHTSSVSDPAPVIRSSQAPATERYKEIQQALVDKGYYKGEVTGQWNSVSTEAMRAFQSDQNLRVDGKVSSLSLIALGLGPRRTVTTQSAPPETPTPAIEIPSVSVP